MIPQKLSFNTPLIYEKYNTNEKPHILGDRNVRFIGVIGQNVLVL